mgnify:CR=1 FL=1
MCASFFSNVVYNFEKVRPLSCSTNKTIPVPKISSATSVHDFMLRFSRSEEDGSPHIHESGFGLVRIDDVLVAYSGENRFPALLWQQIKLFCNLENLSCLFVRYLWRLGASTRTRIWRICWILAEKVKHEWGRSPVYYNGFRTFSLISVIREKVRNPLWGDFTSVLESTSSTSKNSGFFLRAPIDLILFLNESSNILVTRKTMKPTVPRLMLVKNRCYNKILSFFQNIMYAPL